MKTPHGVEEAIAQIEQATAAPKCWTCGCLHSTVDSIERAFPTETRPKDLDAAIRTAREHFAPIRYDCLGCAVCYPALAVNALQKSDPDGRLAMAACPTEETSARDGWPPFPGSYTLRRYQAPVAICALTDDTLSQVLARDGGAEVGITGTLQTENLGIERLIQNVIANPYIRFLILCGPDSRQAIGHLPAQSLLALARQGLDERGRIIGAQGKRPVIRNLDRAAVEHFRETVEVVDMVGVTDIGLILELARSCASRNPGPSAPFASSRVITPTPGYLPEHMTSDPAGYVVVYVDRQRTCLYLEHYRNDGVLDAIVEGRTAAEVYIPVIERAWISRLDHAAYLGRELARAESALRTGDTYIQDGAAERQPVPGPEDCGCGPSCNGA